MSAPPRAGVAARWDDFWFVDTPPHVYALLRILFGALGIAGVAGLMPPSMFWSLDGFTPVVGGGLGLKSELVRLGLATAAGNAFFVALLAAFIAMAAGLLTGWAVAACFAGSLLQLKWNPLPLSAAHAVVMGVLFCLLWTDCGAVWSVDAALLSRRGDRRTPPGSPIWPLRLMRYQVALIYLNTALWKLFSPMWRDGSAVHYVLQLNAFHRFPAVVPARFDWITTLATYLTLSWEVAFPFMLLNRTTRRVALGVGVLMHLGMWVALELGPFSWVMICSYAAFLDPQRVSGWSQSPRRSVGFPTRSIPPESAALSQLSAGQSGS